MFGQIVDKGFSEFRAIAGHGHRQVQNDRLALFGSATRP